MEGHYRVTLWAGQTPLMQGWWETRATADNKLTRWIGAYGGRDGARVTLDDEETGARLTSWPTEA